MRRAAIAWTGILLVACGACGPKRATPGADPRTPATFASPRAAADALVAACRTNDRNAVTALVGAGNEAVFVTGDAARDAERCRRFVAAAERMTRLDPWGPTAVVLVVGVDEYPVPTPIVQDARGWRFDAAAGATELRRRRVGEDELTAIATCRAWAERGGAAPATRHGYTYRTVGSGRQTTLVAAPTEPGLTGVMTFRVGRDGVVREKNLGPDTVALAAALSASVDTGWAVTVD